MAERALIVQSFLESDDRVIKMWGVTTSLYAFMPERSKGFDSSSNIFVCVGSNPTECTIFLSHGVLGFGTNYDTFLFGGALLAM